MSTQPRPEHGTSRVTGRTLKEALENARRLYGDGVRIAETRGVERRDAKGLGRSRHIEVVVALPDAAPELERRVRPAASVADLEAEVQRIEQLVAGLATEAAAAAAPEPPRAQDPLDRALLAAGSSPAAVRHLRRLREAEGARDPQAHLRGQLRAAGGRWQDLAGVHVFLGGAGAGKSDLVLGAAAALKAAGRKVLVLSLTPRHKGDVRRLQEEAAERGYDAAVLREAAQFARSLPLLPRYDAVLVDTPCWHGQSLRDETVRRFVADNEDLHRHLVLPLDLDLGDRERLWETGRSWNCDWLALTRGDLSARPGRLLDVLLTSPFPVSLRATGPWPDELPVIADAGSLAELCARGAVASLGAAAAAGGAS
ncbi:MAG: hypothetical protein IPM94_05215 [bacterium]|nr:hypothetical protein [bacterium]